MKISKLDHLVITVDNVERTIHFYNRVLGIQPEEFVDGRKALRFADQKINLHEAGKELKPHAIHPVAGSADICFITETPLQQVIAHLHSCHVDIIQGPLKKIGASGSLLSIYIRDPDGNLIEIANEIKA